MGVLEDRRQSSQRRLEELQKKLPDSETLASRKACVYATGSFARGEASNHSDLDLFMVGKCDSEQRKPGDSVLPKRLLKRLDEICIKAELISASRELGIPEFSGDGQYLAFYTVSQLVSSLGSPEDDATNTFTARLLLLLESTPLVEQSVYVEVIDEVIEPYWRDFEDHPANFMPAFLANDILRLWRTFCVNYEARTETDPPERKAKRKLKNYKLKHSRMLTCYSALLFLLATHRLRGTVRPQDVVQMTSLSPTQRLDWLRREYVGVASRVDELLQRYVQFLEVTNAAETTLVSRFLDPVDAKKLLEDSYSFGDAVHQLLERVGKQEDGRESRFYRLLLV